jgi:hypothetical protein
MKICPYCARTNREGVFFCEDCGEVLFGKNITSTRQLEAVTTELLEKNTWGTARVGRESKVVLHFRDGDAPIVLGNQDEIILGRSDPNSPSIPTVDLSPIGAQEKGVSRAHAAIRRGDETLTLVDLGSVNGTHLNGQRLVPNQPRVLRDGDEIRLGMMVCHIFFNR